jgi:hypothetical protein
MKLKSVILVAGIAAALLSAPPVQAQTVDPAVVLNRVCLPYAGRSASFERAVRVARDLRFGQPAGSPPLDDYASEVELTSNDGVWRIRLEERTVTRGDRDAYALTCALSSERASVTDLGRLIDGVVNGNARWTAGGNGVRWQRQGSDDALTEVVVKEPDGQRPVLDVTGLYF